MKICFLSLNLYMHGGIQRVAPCILNSLVENHDITVLMPFNEEKDRNIFSLNSAIKIVNLNKFPKHSKKTVSGAIAITLWKINKKTAFLNHKVMLSIASKVMFSKKQKKTLVNYFASEKFDIVIGVTDYYSLLLGIIAPYMDAATIGWQHNTFESYFELKGKNSYGLKKLCEREFANLSQLMVLTNVDRMKYSECFGIPTVTMYNPVAFLKENNKPSIKKDLIFVGRLYQYQKGLDYLVEIMEYIVDKRPNIKLKVIGDGPDRKNLEKMIEEKNLVSNIELVGMTSEVSKYYSDASVFVHPSRYEGFGVVLVEAMAFGLPIVAFHNNGPDEIILDGKNGILIEQFDTAEFAKQVILLLDDAERYKRMSDAARVRAEDFSINQIVQNFEENLYRVLDKKEIK